MAKHINTPFTLDAPYPIDTRTQVSTYDDLAYIPVVYIGLKCYVVSEDAEYRYKSSGWQKIVYGGTSGSVDWGSIGGSLGDQEDLIQALSNKFNVSGGTISGDVFGQGIFEAVNFILTGSTASTPGEVGYIPYEGAIRDININDKIIESSATIAQIIQATGGVLITKEFLETKLKENPQKVIEEFPYTLTNSDFNYVLFLKNGVTPATVVIPAGLSVNFCCGMVQKGVADITLVERDNAILVNPVGFKIRGKNHAVFIEKNLNTTEYNILGDTKI